MKSVRIKHTLGKTAGLKQCEAQKDRITDEEDYSSGQERSEDDIRATLEDIYTTWGDIFFRMKNAINFQKFI